MTRDLLKPAAVLFIVTLCAAAIIGVTYSVTEEPIREQRANAEMAAVLDLLPDTYRIEFQPISDGDLSLTGLTTSFDQSGGVIGYIFSAAPTGYSGTINMMVAIDPAGIVQGLRIIRHTETPGLGSNITQDWFIGEFSGRTGVLISSHNPTGANEIPMIASATISVNAVLRGVNDAIMYFESRGNL